MIFENMIKQRYEGGCTTVVVGKNASKTGRVIVGHNEDDGKSLVMLHTLPRVENEPGSTIKFGDSEQEFPLPETSAIPLLYSTIFRVRSSSGANFTGFREWKALTDLSP